MLPLPINDVTIRRSPVGTPRRRRTRPFDSPHFATASSARRLGKDELLHEAELEIVSSRRSRSRSSFRTEIGYESEDSEVLLPGGWKRTPGKRKRSGPRLSQFPGDAAVRPVKSKGGRPWGVKEWRRLEKAYKAEKAAWIEKREFLPLPTANSPFLGWIRKGKAPELEEWDASKAVSRFMETEGVEGDLGGEWDRYVRFFQALSITDHHC